jgi:hypothetical protein
MVMTEHPHYRVFRVRLAHRNKRLRELTLRARYKVPPDEDKLDVTARFVLDPHWRPPQGAKRPATIIRATPFFHWGAAGSAGAAGQDLVPSIKAPAYRVLWASTEARYKRNQVSTVVLPRMLDFAAPEGKDISLPIGDGTVSWPDKMTRPIYVGVVPLFADGTEGPKPPPTKLDPPDIPALRRKQLEESRKAAQRHPIPPDPPIPPEDLELLVPSEKRAPLTWHDREIGVAECDAYLSKVKLCLPKIPAEAAKKGSIEGEAKDRRDRWYHMNATVAGRARLKPECKEQLAKIEAEPLCKVPVRP